MKNLWKNLKPIVLFRSSLAEENELESCKKYFPVIQQRSSVLGNELVIPRYSALPYYREFETDVQTLGGQLINSYQQHLYVADLKNWYEDLADYTPKTWFRLEDIPEQGPFVLKGATNSKKHKWRTHMYAENKREAIQVYSRLCDDGYIGSQDIYVREYVPLREFGTALQGLPITQEYRFFVLYGEIISGAFYWSEHVDFIEDEYNFVPKANSVPEEWLQNIVDVVSSNINFVVIDVARTATGEWIVIELNDGSCAGLSENDPNILYSNMRKVLDNNL